MFEPIHLSVACPDAETARIIARAAVEARLAACGNIVPGVLSVFRWQGAVETGAEVLLILKSRDDLAAPLAELAAREHPYDLPAITWERVEADAATAAWIARETG